MRVLDLPRLLPGPVCTRHLAVEVQPAKIAPLTVCLASEAAADTNDQFFALRFVKEAVLESMNSPLERGLQFECKSFQLLFDTPDKTEGIRARLEKRAPRFAQIAGPLGSPGERE